MSNRRQWLRGLSFAIGASINGGAVRAFAKPKATAAEQGSAPAERLALADYEPKSMLQVHETQIERARFPAIDIHTHITVSAKSENGVGLSPDRKYLGTPDELLAVMDRKNLRTMVNLTGGYDAGLVEAIGKYDKSHPGRFITFTEPCYSRFLEPDYS
ncbi:MAG TPA: hypothetical protein VIG91_04675, partial [Terriglobales bacterium]